MKVNRACDNSPMGAAESWVSLASLESAVAVPVETDSLPRPKSGFELAVVSGTALTVVSSLLSSDVLLALLELVVFVEVVEVAEEVSSSSSSSEPPAMALVAKPVPH